MSKYINADELMNWVYEQKVFTGIGTEKGKAVFDAYMKMQRKIISADVVEVVRCEDCKFYKAEGNYCDRDIVKSLLATEPTDFCSWAERRKSE